MKHAVKNLPNHPQMVAALGGDLRPWARRCHEAALTLVRAKVLPEGARVARGFHDAVLGQHSWVALGNPYDPASIVVDPTLWSYTMKTRPPRILVGVTGRTYRPKGSGDFWKSGPGIPFAPPTRPVIELKGLSGGALAFLKLIAPEGLDSIAWHTLANAPVQGWPAAEIVGAMNQDARLKAFIPIDVVGMLTDTNPGQLYW